ncbi:MAG TPA: MarP family serine protease [Candidatus Limnocylindrales bacterium]|nr:MarP family serine protease [Candidatus Limnocylindrales bacterium]
MNPVDLLAVALVLIAAVAGFRSGALPQLGGIAGAVVGVGAAVLVLPGVIELLAGIDPTTRALIALLVLLAAVVTAQGVGSGIGAGVGRSLGAGVLSAADRLAGSMLGGLQALLVVWLAGGLLAVAPFPRLSEQASGSQVIRSLAAVLPPPTELAGDVGAVLDGAGLTDVFVGLEPIPAPPVDAPSDPRAAAIARPAMGSLARVNARACGRHLTGTAFAVADDYLVTNAHVLAGATTVRVDGGAVLDARIVLFDPDLDIAVLHAPGADLPALRFATASPGRGDGGAILGYPGGGSLTAIPAAVTDRYVAIGRDIHGRSRVRREVLELRADVEQGDSGGPLVLADGTVGGVVFAESRTNEDVGYALAPGAVATRVGPALGRTAAVDPGRCIP